MPQTSLPLSNKAPKSLYKKPGADKKKPTPGPKANWSKLI
jgi:hypothetical protein